MRSLGLAPLLFAVSLSALATTIPADLETRAASLRSHASPALLSWTHDQGVALAKGGGLVDVAAIERNASSSWAVLGSMQGADIEAIAFLVLMEAAKSAQEDVKAIMADVKAINNAKAKQRDLLRQSQSSAAALPTPTPAPNRVEQFVTAARRVEPKTARHNLSKVVRR